MIAIVAAVGGEIERNRKALLAGRKVAAVERVGIFRRGETGILPDGPGLVDIHGRVGAAQVRRDARPGIEEINALEIGFAIAGFYEDAFGREPRLGAAGGFGPDGLFKFKLPEGRYSGPCTPQSLNDPRRAPPPSLGRGSGAGRAPQPVPPRIPATCAGPGLWG